jgi:flavin reductase (DIM6/NTAB) family NADH-FMN oxidoreductase RutF
VSSPLPEPRPDDLRRLFRRHAAGVAVVTANHGGTPVGLLVTSRASVTTAPPLLSFNVALTASSWPALRDARHLGVHVLAGSQEALAARFALSGADRFSPPTQWRSGPYQVPLLDGCAATAVAHVERRLPVADHVIVVARLLPPEADDGADPLLHHDGAFHRPARPPSLTALRGHRGRRP